MIKQTSSLMGESIYYPARARGLTRGREEAVDEATDAHDWRRTSLDVPVTVASCNDRFGLPNLFSHFGLPDRPPIANASVRLGTV
jgi:hypothetical protein